MNNLIIIIDTTIKYYWTCYHHHHHHDYHYDYDYCHWWLFNFIIKSLHFTISVTL